MDAAVEIGRNPVSNHQIQRFSKENEEVETRRDSQNLSRETKFSGANGDKEFFPCSADHEQHWQPHAVDLYSAICDDHTCIHIPGIL